MMNGAYLVFDPDRDPYNRFLGLDGPAAYPRWGYGSNATAMTYQRAHQFASAYGSKNAFVVNVDRANDEMTLMVEVQEAVSRRALACGNAGL